MGSRSVQEGDDRVRHLSALSRSVLGALALVLLPLFSPGFAQFRWLLAIYLSLAAMHHLLIWKRVGPRWRPFVGSAIDLAMLTFAVHRLGSVTTLLIWAYFFASILSAIVVTRRDAVIIASAAATSYSGVVVLEMTGILPYGPDAPTWILGRPTAEAAVSACIFVSFMLLASSWIVATLVSRLRARERELIAANARLQALSERDSLTGLYNRRYLVARLTEELAQVRRGRALSIVMIDLDNFKQVNDAQGHEEGDRVLAAIARGLEEVTRETDVAGRYGGDEFVVLLRDTDMESATAVAARFVEAVGQVGEEFGHEPKVTASAGVSYARPRDNPRSAMRRADEHAYAAKNSGGNRVSAPEPESSDPREIDHSGVTTLDTPSKAQSRDVRG